MRASKEPSLLAEALRLAELGFRVIPISGKVPLIKDWPHVASNERSKIERLFGKHGIETTGVGIVVDEGFVVVDFDPRNGGDWADYDLPDTIVCHTGGGGRHYYYRLPDGVKSQSKKVASGVELKGFGGYVVAPPSRHPSGGKYVWEVEAAPWERPMAPAPAWILAEQGGVNEKFYALHPPIRRGQRHMFLISLAGALRGAGVDEDTIDLILREVYEAFFEKEDFDFEREITNLRRYYTKWSVGKVPLDAVLSNLSTEIRQIVADYITEVEVPKKVIPRRRSGWAEAAEVLRNAKWVSQGGKLYIVEGNTLIPAPLAHIYLAEKGVVVGQESAKRAVEYALNFIEPEDLIGVVLGRYITEGRAGGHFGLWRYCDGKIYCHTANEVLVFEDGSAPEGLYRMHNRASIRIAESGGIDDLLKYMIAACARVDADPRVVTAMIAPILLGAGDAGFVLTGPAGSGKSMLAKALALLEGDREWMTPAGAQMRDLLASIATQRVTFFDDAKFLQEEMQALIRSKLTKGWVGMRMLYSDEDIVNRRLEGSMILCTTNVENLSHDLADRSFYIRFKNEGATMHEEVLLGYFVKNSQKARAGLVELWRKAQSVDVPKGILPQVRFRKWVDIAYRMAVVLGVKEEFEKFVSISKILALGSLKFGFLVEALYKKQIHPEKPYRIKDIWVMTGRDPEDEEIASLARGLGRGAKHRREIETIANAFQYTVRFEKRVVQKENRNKELVLIFTEKDRSFYEHVEDFVEDVWSKMASMVVKVDTGTDSKGAPEPSPSSDAFAEEKVSMQEDRNLEALITKYMQADTLPSYDPNDPGVAPLLRIVEAKREAWSPIELSKRLIEFIKNSGEEIFAEENRNVLNYLLGEIIKSRREYGRHET